MTPVHSHYENLRVARNAPPEVIRAAYKALSQRYHPDLNPGDAEAARIMALINVAYDTLSDPAKRAEHDRWITDKEQLASSENRSDDVGATSERAVNQGRSNAHVSSSAARAGIKVAAVLRNIRTYWYWYLILFAVIWPSISDRPPRVSRQPSTPPAIQLPETTNPPQVPPQLISFRPATAPNGQPWPKVAGYIKGYPRLQSGGLGKVVIDNSKNDSDVFVKLFSINESKEFPARTFFIPAFSQFTLTSVSPGEYDIRYKDLTSGRMSKTEPFALTQTESSAGTHYRSVTMTLYKVSDGNMQMFPIKESEFN